MTRVPMLRHATRTCALLTDVLSCAVTTETQTFHNHVTTDREGRGAKAVTSLLNHVFLARSRSLFFISTAKNAAPRGAASRADLKLSTHHRLSDRLKAQAQQDPRSKYHP